MCTSCNDTFRAPSKLRTRDNPAVSDENQITVPPSFIALYVPPGRLKPTAPRDEIARRYETCEDLASLLTEHARTLLWQLGIGESDVLGRVRAGLLEPAAGVSPEEARWIVRRLAELLEWEPLADDTDSHAA